MKATPANKLTKKLAGKAPAFVTRWDKRLCMKYTHPNAQQAAFLSEFGERREGAIRMRRFHQGRGSSIYGLKAQKKLMRAADGKLWWHVRNGAGEWVPQQKVA